MRSETPHAEPKRSLRVLVVVDVVESVRLMEANEAEAIRQWREFVEEVRSQVLPGVGGRLVKSLGDGLLLDFPTVSSAVGSAFEMQARIAAHNVRRPGAASMCVRIGAHAAYVVIDELDVYGSGVNLAARLASVAGPGEIVVSSEVRDQLTDGLDSQIVDLGECFLKHIASPVRAFRVGNPTTAHYDETAEAAAADLFPAIAVVPFSSPRDGASKSAIGDAIADAVIAALSTCASIRVVSRLSSAPFRGRAPEEIRFHLGVAYIVSGRYARLGGNVVIFTELSASRTAEVLWSGRHEVSLAEFFRGQDVAVPEIVANIGREVIRSEMARTRFLPIPTLDAYSLYVGGIALLHRTSIPDFSRAYDVLEGLSQRHPRIAAPRAMLARWHVLKLLQGWSLDPRMEGQRAQDWARRALELDPCHAFALATDALVTAHFGDDLKEARSKCLAAVLSDPQEAQAWMTLAGVQSYLGEGSEAESSALRAIALSPMDPTRFLFDLLLGAAQLAAGKYADAAESARSSLRQNAMHLASHRLLVIALSLRGSPGEARAAAKQLTALAPNFRVSEYAARYPGRNHSHAATYVEALLDAGIPN